MKALREHDIVDVPHDAPLDLQPFLGVWEKTNEKPGQWIRRVEIARSGDANISVRVRGGDAPSPDDWGARPADELFATAINSSLGGGFIVRFDHGSLVSELQGNVNLGLLVLAGFNRFAADSGRSDLFTREFFHRVNA